MTTTMPETDEAQQIIEALDLDESVPCESASTRFDCDELATWSWHEHACPDHPNRLLLCDRCKRLMEAAVRSQDAASHHCRFCGRNQPLPWSRYFTWIPINLKRSTS